MLYSVLNAYYKNKRVKLWVPGLYKKRKKEKEDAFIEQTVKELKNLER